jgi:hypothetical protein
VESEVLAAEAAGFELLSVFEARVQGQESMRLGYRAGKSDTGVVSFASNISFVL